jgi:3-polyprenyl-4-hydroxybenzoate decarboxylase
LLLTNVDLDLKEFGVLLENILMRFNPARDLIIIHDTAMDTLDYTGRLYNQGSKAILLGIGDPVRQLPDVYRGGPLPGIKKAKSYCRGCLLVSGPGLCRYSELPQNWLRQIVRGLRTGRWWS